MSVRVAVFGLGRMGSRHVRTAAGRPDVSIVGAVDPRRAGSSTPEGVPVFSSGEELPEFDVAIVATPAATHAALVTSLLERGVDVLVEKPLAIDRSSCEAVRVAAARTGRRVAVGHVERFNPAFEALERALSLIGEVVEVSFERVGTSAAPGTDRADVLLELAIHDLDLMARLVGPAVVRDARCAPPQKPTSADVELVARGARARVHVNSAADRVSRRVVVQGVGGVLVSDLFSRTCTLRTEDAVRELPVGSTDPLCAQLDAFLAMLRGAPSRVCDVEDATRAVALAEEARHLSSRAPAGALARW